MSHKSKPMVPPLNVVGYACADGRLLCPACATDRSEPVTDDPASLGLWGTSTYGNRWGGRCADRIEMTCDECDALLAEELS